MIEDFGNNDGILIVGRRQSISLYFGVLDLRNCEKKMVEHLDNAIDQGGCKTE